MAKTTVLLDDMDGSIGAKPRYFSINGIDYSVELNDDNYSAFLKTMEPWRSIATVARKPRKQAHPPLSADERKAIRAWAAEEGIQLADRGRFPNEVVARFFEEQDLLTAKEWLADEPALEHA